MLLSSTSQCAVRITEEPRPSVVRPLVVAMRLSDWYNTLFAAVGTFTKLSSRTTDIGISQSCACTVNAPTKQIADINLLIFI